MSIPFVTGTTNIFGVANTINRIINEKLETTGGTLSGDLKVISGSPTIPSLGFSAFPTTGIYSSGSNNISFTFGGTELVRFHANGNIGMGIYNSTSNIEILKSTNTNIKLSKIAGSSVELKTLTSASEIGTTVNHPLIIKTNNTEVARFSNTAFFGIGTTTPETRLEVKSPTGTAIRFGTTGQTSGGALFGTNTGALISGGSYFNGTNWIATSTSSSLFGLSENINFYVNSGLTLGASFTPIEVIRVDSTGKVGLKTFTPQFDLDVNGTIHADESLTVRNDNFGYVTIQSTGSVGYSARVDFYTQENIRRGNISAGDGFLSLSAENGYSVNLTGPSPKINGNEIWHVGNLSPYQQSRNTVTTNYTLALSDIGKIVETFIAVSNSVTIPNDSTVNFPIGTRIDLFQLNTGQTTITPASGVTLRAVGNRFKFNTQYSSASLWKRDPNDWVLSGDLVS